MQPRIQAARAVSREEAVGVDETAELNMFTNTFVYGHFLVHCFFFTKILNISRGAWWVGDHSEQDGRTEESRNLFPTQKQKDLACETMIIWNWFDKTSNCDKLHTWRKEIEIEIFVRPPCHLQFETHSIGCWLSVPWWNLFVKVFWYLMLFNSCIFYLHPVAKYLSWRVLQTSPKVVEGDVPL